MNLNQKTNVKIIVHGLHTVVIVSHLLNCTSYL